jgi:hypothetical protein
VNLEDVEKRRKYFRDYQNNRYLTDVKYRESKKKNAKNWKEKNIGRFREYQRVYSLKKRKEIKERL